MNHPLIDQLHFARAELQRCLAGVTDEDARRRIVGRRCSCAEPSGLQQTGALAVDASAIISVAGQPTCTGGLRSRHGIASSRAPASRINVASSPKRAAN